MDVEAPGSSPEVFLRLLRPAGLRAEGLRASEAWSTFVAFAQVPFVVPGVPDGDGLLYQFGVYGFSGEARFHLDLVRQFAVEGCEEHLQFHCDLQFSVSEQVRPLGRHSEWWWPDAGLDLPVWAAGIARRPEWPVLDSQRPLAVDVYCETT